MPTRTRVDTLFDLRYACRVLERYASMHGKLRMALTFFTLLSGGTALAALVGDKTGWALGLGVFFAVLQALDHAVGPGDKRAQAQAMRREYARVLARGDSLSSEALEAAYRDIVASDDIQVPRGLKELAYDDVVCEQGLDAAACYRGSRLLSALS